MADRAAGTAEAAAAMLQKAAQKPTGHAGEGWSQEKMLAEYYCAKCQKTLYSLEPGHFCIFFVGPQYFTNLGTYSGKKDATVKRGVFQ